MRTYEEFHCPAPFRRAFAALLDDRRPGELQMVEVGSYLGGCTFWAAQEAAAASTRFVGTSVEPYPPAAQAQRETARTNGCNVTVVEACVGKGRINIRMNRQHAPEAELSDAGMECQAFEAISPPRADVIRSHPVGENEIEVAEMIARAFAFRKAPRLVSITFRSWATTDVAAFRGVCDAFAAQRFTLAVGSMRTCSDIEAALRDAQGRGERSTFDFTAIGDGWRQ